MKGWFFLLQGGRWVGFGWRDGVRLGWVHLAVGHGWISETLDRANAAADALLAKVRGIGS